MATSKQLLLLLTLAAHAVAAAAAENSSNNAAQATDTSQWKCKFCVFEKGLSGSVDLGVGYVSSDSYKFGEYNGLYEQGVYAIGGANARYRGEDANYLNIDVSDLGLNTRALHMEGGKQGLYKLLLDYKELPHAISDTVQTPFVGIGTDVISLPPGLVTAAGTSAMTALAGSLHPENLETKRKRVGVGAWLSPTPTWQYAVSFRHESKEGTQSIGGTFYFSAAQLIRPVNYETNQMDASASYTGKKLQAKFAYGGSIFHNSNEALVWQNPYTPLFGAGAGQLALPPDNQFHQVIATVGYQFSERTRGSADIAIGRMTQDEAFLASTLNSTLVVPPLPRSSLNGKVATINANLKLSSTVTNKLRLDATYIYNDRDNQTPQAAYAWISSDSFVNAPVTSLPYSFTQSTLKLRADYRIGKEVRSSVGFDNDSRKRTFQEADSTNENTVWMKVIAQTLQGIDVTFGLAHAKRDQSGYAPVATVTPPENPLLTKYYMANRTRDSARFRIDAAVGATASVGLGIDLAQDDYPDSTLGLIGDKDLTFSGDATVMLTKETSMHFFLNHEEIRSKQVGSQTFSTQDWTGYNNDMVDYVGLGFKRAMPTKKLDVGADYTVTQSHGQITMVTGLPSAPFTDLVSKRESLKLYGTYRLRANMSLQGAYWYEQYDSENWLLAGVTPSTIPNVLTFGQLPPSYHLNVITMTYRYKFK